MNPMTDERLRELLETAKVSRVLGYAASMEMFDEIDRLRAELAETQAEMKPLAAHVQRDFEQAEEIARLLTRNEKLQAELAECRKRFTMAFMSLRGDVNEKWTETHRELYRHQCGEIGLSPEAKADLDGEACGYASVLDLVDTAMRELGIYAYEAAKGGG